MKKLLLLAAAALSLAACEGKIGPPGPQGPPGQNGQDGNDGLPGRDGEGTDWASYTFTVRPHEWELRGGEPGDLNTWFVAYKPWKISQHIYENASVVAYIEVEPGARNGMPYVLHRGEANPDGGDDFRWTETYDFDFTTTEVGFYLTYSDFNTAIRPTETQTFHVVMFWQ